MHARWHTFGPGIALEETKREIACSTIERWWRSFAARSDDIAAIFCRQQHWDLPAWMQENLQAISPYLMWEFGPGREGGHPTRNNSRKQIRFAAVPSMKSSSVLPSTPAGPAPGH